MGRRTAAAAAAVVLALLGHAQLVAPTAATAAEKQEKAEESECRAFLLCPAAHAPQHSMLEGRLSCAPFPSLSHTTLRPLRSGCHASSPRAGSIRSLS
jgi:hypothetical protein